MSARRASDVFVECLEAEGVRYVFGIPGEETLDLNESLSRSSIEFVPVRHEQGGAYMADGQERDRRVGQRLVEVEGLLARDAEDVLHALRLEALDEEVRRLALAQGWSFR